MEDERDDEDQQHAVGRALKTAIQAIVIELPEVVKLRQHAVKTHDRRDYLRQAGRAANCQSIHSLQEELYLVFEYDKKDLVDHFGNASIITHSPV